MPRNSQIVKHESIVSNTVPISNKFRGILKPLSGSRIFIELPENIYGYCLLKWKIQILQALKGRNT